MWGVKNQGLKQCIWDDHHSCTSTWGVHIRYNFLKNEFRHGDNEGSIIFLTWGIKNQEVMLPPWKSANVCVSTSWVHMSPLNNEIHHHKMWKWKNIIFNVVLTVQNLTLGKNNQTNYQKYDAHENIWVLRRSLEEQIILWRVAFPFGLEVPFGLPLFAARKIYDGPFIS